MESKEEYLKDVWRRAEKITRMLNGTMSMEGQGLDEETLGRMTEDTIKEIIIKDSDNFDAVT